MSHAQRLRQLWRVWTGRALVYQPDGYTDGFTPLMCREVLAQGDRFCERPRDHDGAHWCRATEHRHGAVR